jgi:hypothetical protein
VWHAALLLSVSKDDACLELARTIYIVYIQYFWQGNHQIYGHVRCSYTVLASPMYDSYSCLPDAYLQCSPEK